MIGFISYLILQLLVFALVLHASSISDSNRPSTDSDFSAILPIHSNTSTPLRSNSNNSDSDHDSHGAISLNACGGKRVPVRQLFNAGDYSKGIAQDDPFHFTPIHSLNEHTDGLLLNITTLWKMAEYFGIGGVQNRMSVKAQHLIGSNQPRKQLFDLAVNLLSEVLADVIDPANPMTSAMHLNILDPSVKLNEVVHDEIAMGIACLYSAQQSQHLLGIADIVKLSLTLLRQHDKLFKTVLGVFKIIDQADAEYLENLAMDLGIRSLVEVIHLVHSWKQWTVGHFTRDSFVSIDQLPLIFKDTGIIKYIDCPLNPTRIPFHLAWQHRYAQMVVDIRMRSRNQDDHQQFLMISLWRRLASNYVISENTVPSSSLDRTSSGTTLQAVEGLRNSIRLVRLQIQLQRVSLQTTSSGMYSELHRRIGQLHLNSDPGAETLLLLAEDYQSYLIFRHYVKREMQAENLQPSGNMPSIGQRMLDLSQDDPFWSQILNSRSISFAAFEKWFSTHRITLRLSMAAPVDSNHCDLLTHPNLPISQLYNSISAFVLKTAAVKVHHNTPLFYLLWMATHHALQVADPPLSNTPRGFHRLPSFLTSLSTAQTSDAAYINLHGLMGQANCKHFGSGVIYKKETLPPLTILRGSSHVDLRTAMWILVVIWINRLTSMPLLKRWQYLNLTDDDTLVDQCSALLLNAGNPRQMVGAMLVAINYHRLAGESSPDDIGHSIGRSQDTTHSVKLSDYLAHLLENRPWKDGDVEYQRVRAYLELRACNGTISLSVILEMYAALYDLENSLHSEQETLSSLPFSSSSSSHGNQVRSARNISSDSGSSRSRKSARYLTRPDYSHRSLPPLFPSIQPNDHDDLEQNVGHLTADFGAIATKKDDGDSEVGDREQSSNCRNVRNSPTVNRIFAMLYNRADGDLSEISKAMVTLQYPPNAIESVQSWNPPITRLNFVERMMTMLEDHQLGWSETLEQPVAYSNTANEQFVVVSSRSKCCSTCIVS